MTFEELTIGGKIICMALVLMPFGAGWLGEQFGRWLRGKYEQHFKIDAHEKRINRQRRTTWNNP